MSDRFTSPWWIVVGSVLGLLFSVGPVIQFSFGAFLLPVAKSLGVDRATLSLALLLSLCASGLAVPLVGRLVDRFGIRIVAAPLVALFALSIAAIGVCAHSPAAYLGCYAVAGLFGASQTPLIYAKSIASAFDANRGLALGIAMAGVGVGAALAPKLAQVLILRLGWQHAYMALGAITFLVAVPSVALFLRDPPLRVAAPGERGAAVAADGESIVATVMFWRLATAVLLIALAAAGVVAHLIPMMIDHGVSAQTAALAVGAGGAALVVGRLLAGYCLDVLFAPYVAGLFLTMPLVGILILLKAASPSQFIGAGILVGMGLGAEIDLMAYLQSRYLGVRRFGEIYGYLLMIFMFGSGVGPFTIGMSYRHFGSYSPALGSFAVGVVIAIAILLTLGRYRFGKTPRQLGSRAS
jgi:MFS family permease